MNSQSSSDAAALAGAPLNSLIDALQMRLAMMLDCHRVYLSPREAADYLRVSERMIFDLTVPRGPIPVVRVGRLVKYDKADLIAFMDGAKQRQVANAPPAQAS